MLVHALIFTVASQGVRVFWGSPITSPIELSKVSEVRAGSRGSKRRLIQVTAPVSNSVATELLNRPASGVGIVNFEELFLTYGIERPVYPRDAEESGTEGDVHISLKVDELGHVVDLEIPRSSGHRSLDRAVTEVAPRWRIPLSYLKGRRNLSVLVEFRLRG